MRKVLFTIAIVVIAAVAGVTCYNNAKEEEMSDLAKANIEALANGNEWCTDCEVCTGEYYICESDYDNWWDEALKHCSGIDVVLIFIPGC